MSPTNRRQAIANFLDHDGPLTLRDLAARLSIDQTTLYIDVTQMEHEGRIERDPIAGRRDKAVKPKQSLYRWRLVA